jgi:predicted RNA binding protein YcfA (HicA-like mRNA interferase family)
LKLPRDLSGVELAKLLRKFVYEITRQSGSHMRVTSRHKGVAHHVTIPAHSELKVGTLGEVLGEVAHYLEMERNELVKSLFAQ